MLGSAPAGGAQHPAAACSLRIRMIVSEALTVTAQATQAVQSELNEFEITS